MDTTVIKVSEFLNDTIITEKIINSPNTSLDTIQNLPIFEDNLSIISENCLFIYQVKEIIKKGYLYNTSIQEKCLLYKFELIPITYEFNNTVKNSKEIETQTESESQVDHFAKFLDTKFNQINFNHNIEYDQFYSEQQHENAEQIYYPIQSENCQYENCECCGCDCECCPLISKFQEINLNESIPCILPSDSVCFDTLRQQTLTNNLNNNLNNNLTNLNVVTGNLISELKIRLDKPNHGLNYTRNYFNYSTI